MMFLFIKRFFFPLAVSLPLLTSCNWFKQKTKETVNKTGEMVAKTGSEFANGIYKGVEKTFQNRVTFSDLLKQDGLKTGRIIVSSSDSTIDNILTVYFIFDRDFDKEVTVKVFDGNEQEYGRVTQKIKGKEGEAKYINFIFDKRTNIDGKGKITFE